MAGIKNKNHIKGELQQGNEPPMPLYNSRLIIKEQANIMASYSLLPVPAPVSPLLTPSEGLSGLPVNGGLALFFHYLLLLSAGNFFPHVPKTAAGNSVH